jgi:hypothetical protein
LSLPQSCSPKQGGLPDPPERLTQAERRPTFERRANIERAPQNPMQKSDPRVDACGRAHVRILFAGRRDAGSSANDSVQVVRTIGP